MRPNYEQIAASWSLQALAENTDRSIWRYAPLLPLRQHPSPHHCSGLYSLNIGWTPLIRAARLGASLGLAHLLIKDDSRNPTGSLKDRASALVVAHAINAGETTLATASSGNAAASLAGLCAAEGMPCVIFVPHTIPPGKLAQLLMYGAHVFLVEGSYNDAVELCRAACSEFGWYARNTGYNPYTAEGKKQSHVRLPSSCRGRLRI
ncbi:MAG TPA: pyridoxal-phosphate dependent enzyme [Herpetosiphonaceae bacterium]